MPMRITASNVEQIVDVTLDEEAPIGNVALNTEGQRSKELQEPAISAGTAGSIGTTVLTRSQEQKE